MGNWCRRTSVKEDSSNADQIVEGLLRPAFACLDPMILALQETTSWDVDDFNFPGFFQGCKKGSATILVSDQICSVQKSGWAEERCTALQVT